MKKNNQYYISEVKYIYAYNIQVIYIVTTSPKRPQHPPPKKKTPQVLAANPQQPIPLGTPDSSGLARFSSSVRMSSSSSYPWKSERKNTYKGGAPTSYITWKVDRWRHTPMIVLVYHGSSLIHRTWGLPPSILSLWCISIGSILQLEGFITPVTLLVSAIYRGYM